ncbi:hypothetical protein [Brevundimonas aurantiaca]|jgi:hypothetical protein|uniref:hypothetical protein n=1 Tax=Brevundimonas aurantiaca TaxID=74316 RepID=UPI001D1802D1|nr:hypothetical protein [Brevundimonas aurantiaca]MCC4295856.1 hypothetical protein [Brevundimonas aurantiaca]
MKKIIVAVLLLGGCQFVPGSDQQRIEAAQKRVASELRDPAGAEFRNSRIKDGWVCGEVNGKNAYGGYAGFQRFVVGPDSVSLEEITKDDAAARQYFEVLWIGCD